MVIGLGSNPFNGIYRVSTRGDGDSLTFTVVEEDDFFTFTPFAGGFGLIPGQRITETITTPLPATAAMFAVAVGLLGWITRRA